MRVFLLVKVGRTMNYLNWKRERRIAPVALDLHFQVGFFLRATGCLVSLRIRRWERSLPASLLASRLPTLLPGPRENIFRYSREAKGREKKTQQ